MQAYTIGRPFFPLTLKTSSYYKCQLSMFDYKVEADAFKLKINFTYIYNSSYYKWIKQLKVIGEN
jgi:hypothetical protein